MTLRRRLVIAFAGLVTIAVALVGGISYSATVSTFHADMDRTLITAAAAVGSGDDISAPAPRPPSGHGRDEPDGPDDPGRPHQLDDAGGPHQPDDPAITLVQHIAPDGTVTVLKGPAALAVDRTQRLLAGADNGGAGRFEWRTVGAETYRTYTLAQGDDKGAIVVGSNVAEASRVLTRVAINTVLIGLAVILLAALAGWWIARQITRRLASLSGAAESVARTGDLAVPIETPGRDEVGRLAASMRSMLTQLAQSRDAQRRLVEDAGHELRTPITSLRTNASVLRRYDDLSPDDRARLLDDVDGELKELTSLVNELVELATDARPTESAEPVLIRELLERVAARVGRRSGRVITVDADESVLTVQAHAVERAVGNLLDNAVKFDPNGSASIEITSYDGVVTVSDRGPGVPPADLARIFDRFHRSESSRSRPGSGLGLAIVRDVATRHGGAVTATLRPGGGLTVTMTLAEPSPRQD